MARITITFISCSLAYEMPLIRLIRGRFRLSDRVSHFDWICGATGFSNSATSLTRRGQYSNKLAKLSVLTKPRLRPLSFEEERYRNFSNADPLFTLRTRCKSSGNYVSNSISVFQLIRKLARFYLRVCNFRLEVAKCSCTIQGLIFDVKGVCYS